MKPVSKNIWRRIISINHLRKISNKAAVAYYDVMLRHSPGWTAKQNTSHGICFPGRTSRIQVLQQPQCHTLREDCHISESLSIASHHENETINCLSTTYTVILMHSRLGQTREESPLVYVRPGIWTGSFRDPCGWKFCFYSQRIPFYTHARAFRNVSRNNIPGVP
jgi:hypothetical protein